ncbi:MAG: hypothetical protein Q9162_003289 [Coniocarpon cinnabarinum]
MSASSQPRKPDPTATSKERNEYIPSFISKKPFYVAEDHDLTHSTTTTSATSDYLEHQRLAQPSIQTSLATSEQKWYDRGLKKGTAATKYRKGACENCGAMGHSKKECLSRPRKKGARWTGSDIQADVHVTGVEHGGWDAKRDRWNGYDAREHQLTVEQQNEMRQLMEQQTKKAEDAGDGDEDDEEAAKHEHGVEDSEIAQPGKGQKHLRIREDTAKYLLNLDLDSARYDPKTRRMVDEGATADKASALVAEEGFVRQSGDAAEFEKAQRVAWDSQEAGNSGQHVQANPTSGEYFRKKEAEELATKQAAQKRLLAEKYGSQEQFRADRETQPAVVESERFVEYDERGKIKGREKKKTKSSYAEDVLINNHTSVWGSWWDNFQWGYACCHSTVKNSYCAGNAGLPALTAPAEEETELVEESTDARPQEVSRGEAWQEEERREEFVPNGVGEDEKARVDESARKRSISQTDLDGFDGALDGQPRKRLAVGEAAA